MALLLALPVGNLFAEVTPPLASQLVIARNPAASQENNHSAALMEMPDGTLLCLWNHVPENKLGYPEIVASRLPLGASQWSPWKRVLADDERAYINPSLCLDQDNVLWLFYAMSNEAWLYPKPDGTPNDENMQNSSMYYRKSFDYGESWSEPHLVRGRMSPGGPAGYLTGSKPVLLANGGLLVPVYRDFSVQTPTTNIWSRTDALGLVTTDGGRTFTASNPILDGLNSPWVSMPSVQPAADGSLRVWYRTASGKAGGQIFRGTASADGLTWSQPVIPTNSPNGSQARLDTLKLQSGKYLLVCSPDNRGRIQFNLSADDGNTWESQRTTDEFSGLVTVSPGNYQGTVSYPSVTQSRDGLIHCAYTYDGYAQIKHVVLSEDWFRGEPTRYRPAVGLVSPIHGAFLTDPTVTLCAAVLDQDGTLTRVEFIEGGKTIGEAKSAPYDFTGKFTPGVHEITVRATDEQQQTTTTRPVRFTVAANAGRITGLTSVGTVGAFQLSREGALDWIHLGAGGAPAAVTRRKGTPILGTVTALGLTPVSPFGDGAQSFVWQDGDQPAPAGSSSGGVSIAYLGSGFEVTAPADTNVRTLTFYGSASFSRARFDAWLSDGSAPRFTSLQLDSQIGTQSAIYTVHFQAASPGQTLTVRFMNDFNYGSNGSPGAGPVGRVSVQAVTLRNATPVTRNEAPGPNQGATLHGTLTPRGASISLTQEGDLDWFFCTFDNHGGTYHKQSGNLLSGRAEKCGRRPPQSPP